jgi:putative tryptophan/tyrosine transport system substrate-binding protein
MRRRDFIGAISGAALVLPCGAAAQQAGKIWRIGIVVPSTPELGPSDAQALEARLAELGYVQGRNIVVLQRLPKPQPEKIEEDVSSLAPQVDLLVVRGSIAAMAAKKLASGVPIVFISSAYPVEIGLVHSLAHPGGNITGIASEAATETNQKRLQILKEIVPDLEHTAVLRVPDEPFTKLAMPSLELAARKLDISLIPVDIKSADDLEVARPRPSLCSAPSWSGVSSSGSPISRSPPGSPHATYSGKRSLPEDWSASGPILSQILVRLLRKLTRSSKALAQQTFQSSSRHVTSSP